MKIRSQRSYGRKPKRVAANQTPTRARLERRFETRRLKKLPLALLAAVTFAFTLALQLALFSWEPTPPSVPVQQLEDLNQLVEQVSHLLDQEEATKTEAIQELLDRQTQGAVQLLYLDRQVKQASGRATAPAPVQAFEQLSPSEFTLTLPVGLEKVRGLLVVRQAIPPNPPPDWLGAMLLSAAIATLGIALVLWLKTTSTMSQIDLLCRQFVRYRRETETEEMQFPETRERSTDLELRVAVLQDLWSKFQNMQSQLTDNVQELEESKQQLEQTIEDLRKAKEQERRLIELGYAVAEFGHDIGNANGTISTYATLMLRMLDKPTISTMDVMQSIIYLRKINIASANVADLTGDILEFARGHMQLNLSPHNPDEFQAHLEVVLGFAEDIPIDYHFPSAEQTTLLFDGRKITRVLINLVKNAWEKLQEEEAGEITIEIVARAPDLLIRVCDNGSPIPEQVLPVIFQSFQTEGKEKGTGLGLAISKKMIEAHGGSIRAENAKEGVLFEMWLPNACHMLSERRLDVPGGRPLATAEALPRAVNW
jgi:signal transduction histidine kinase